jgi:hypothetical protein
MTQGVSTIILLAVAVVVVAAVIGVTSFGVHQSRDLASDGYGFFSGLNNPAPLNVAQVSGDKPVAAIAVFLRKNKQQITELRCNICGTVSSGDNLGDCLKNHLQSRGLFTLTETDNFTYTAVLS